MPVLLKKGCQLLPSKKTAKIIGIQEQQMCDVGMTTATCGLESWEEGVHTQSKG